ncbi:MAG TPA: hypothetical protein VEC36_00450 [Patescibacteria group bacterium]|nr:hypothetical protein [Patescibacteria group bacterium]
MGYNFTSIYAFNQLRAVAVGETNIIHQTFDGGISWQKTEVEIPGIQDITLQTVTFIDSLQGWVGSSSFIKHVNL